MLSMLRLRRVTALVTTLLLAHLVWVGSGFACVVPATGHSAVAVMAGMDMSGDMPTADMVGMDMSATQHPGGESGPDHAPCTFPWAPDGCQSMAPCAPTALSSHAEALRVLHAVPSPVASLDVRTPPSVKSPPELPPPRA
jgi:hypothetical protein